MEEIQQSSKKSSKKASEIYDWADALVYAIIIIIIVFTLFLRVTRVEGTSMVPTLHENDTLIISNFLYTPTRGDIVVITKEAFKSEPIVKRIIATAGQTVDIDFDKGLVYVDGELQDEPYINAPTLVTGNLTYPLTVEDGFIFVMGDNRNRSTDSRFSEVGLIDTRMVLGKVLFRIMPLSRFGSVYN